MNLEKKTRLREKNIDFFKTILVLGMILAHIIQLIIRKKSHNNTLYK